jgi:hypothetical protein
MHAGVPKQQHQIVKGTQLFDALLFFIITLITTVSIGTFPHYLMDALTTPPCIKSFTFSRIAWFEMGALGLINDRKMRS